MYSRIVAFIADVLHWTPDYILWSLTYPQMMLWLKRAGERRGVKFDEVVSEQEPGDEEWTWNEKKGRFE